MADTNFVDLAPPAVSADWLNDTNRVIYRLLGDSTGSGGTGDAPITRQNILDNLNLTAGTPAAVAYISSLGATPTTADIQTLLDNTLYGQVRFDQNTPLTGNLIVKRPMLVTVDAGVTVTLQDNYTINASKFALIANGTYSSTGQAVGLFHVDTANNTTGGQPGVQGAQIEIYGELVLGFRNGARACGVFMRRAEVCTVKCPGRIYGAWTPIFLCDSDHCLVDQVNAYSDVRDTGSGPNAAVVAEGAFNCTIRNVWGVQYEEGVDMNANNDQMTVDNVRTSGDYDICLEMANGITGPGWKENEAITQTTGGTVITGYVTEWDATHLRLYVKGTAGPFLTTSAVSNSGGSGTSGTPTRVSVSAIAYVSTLVLTSVVGTPTAGQTVVQTTSLTLAGGATAVIPGETINAVPSGASAVVTSYNAGNRVITLTSFIGNFAVGDVVTGVTSGNGGTITTVTGASSKVALWIPGTSTLYLKEVTNSRFSTSINISGGALTSANVSSVTDVFQSQNGMDISCTTNGTFTKIHTLNRFKCLEVFDYPLHSIQIPISAVVGTPAMGESVQGGTSGAVGQIIWYRVSGTTLEIGDYTGTFVAGETLTGLTSGFTATAGTLNYIQDGRVYSERFTGKVSLRNKGNKIQAQANYDQYWVGTGTLASAAVFDVKAGDDSDLDVKAIAIFPTGDFQYFWSSEGGDRIGPPTDNTPPHREVTHARIGIWSTKAPAFNTRDLITFNNVVCAEIRPYVISPVVAGKSAIMVSRSGTNTHPSSAIIIDPVVFQVSCVATDPLPAAAGTGITISSIPGQHEVRGTPMYFNLTTRETLNSDYTVRSRSRRRFTREFSMPGAGANINAGLEKSADSGFTEYSMAAYDEISYGVNWDLTGGAAVNAITLRAGASGLSDGNIRRWVYNPSAGALAIPAGARIRITVEKTVEVDAVSIPLTAVTGLPVIGETVTGGTSTATGVVLWYEYHTATTGTVHMGKLLVSQFAAAEGLTGGTSGFTATAGTPVNNLL